MVSVEFYNQLEALIAEIAERNLTNESDRQFIDDSIVRLQQDKLLTIKQFDELVLAIKYIEVLDNSRTVVSRISCETKTLIDAANQSKRFTHQFLSGLANISNHDKGMIINERYKLDSFIEKEGLGRVFKAWDLYLSSNITSNNAEFTIKFLDAVSHLSFKAKTLFRGEILRLKKLSHPSIANIYDVDFDKTNESVFIVTELIEGQAINALIEKHKHGLSPQLVYQYVADICKALSSAHQQGFVHLNLKPTNIIIFNNSIKIVDFGIAAALGAYTPNYTSPETLRNTKGLGAKDDVFALGCIIYELITGNYPYVHENRKSTSIEAIRLELEAERPEDLNDTQWLALNACLTLDATKRTQSVESFITEFLPSQQPADYKYKSTHIASPLPQQQPVYDNYKNSTIAASFTLFACTGQLQPDTFSLEFS